MVANLLANLLADVYWMPHWQARQSRGLLVLTRLFQINATEPKKAPVQALFK
jgi:hypothetical protein